MAGGAGKKRDLASLLGTAGGGKHASGRGKVGGSILERAQAAAASGSGKRVKTHDGDDGNGHGGKGGVRNGVETKGKGSPPRWGGSERPVVSSEPPNKEQLPKKQPSRWDAPEKEKEPSKKSRWGDDADTDEEYEEEEEEAPNETDKKIVPESYMDKMVREAIEFKIANETAETANVGKNNSTSQSQAVTGVNVAQIMAMRTPSSDGDVTPRDDSETPNVANAERAEEIDKQTGNASVDFGRDGNTKDPDALGDALGDLDALDAGDDDTVVSGDGQKNTEEADSDLGAIEGPSRGPPAHAFSPETFRRPSTSPSPEREHVPDDDDEELPKNDRPPSTSEAGGDDMAAIRDRDTRGRHVSSSPSRDEKKKERFFDSTATCRSVFAFEQMNKIDEGTYGVVFRAKDKLSGKIAALKKVKMEKEKEGFPMTALREARILLSMAHPNIVDVSEMVVGNSLDSVFMVMEFCEHDLRGLIDLNAAKPFSASEVKCFASQLISGVAYMHENWTLHRDLKTSNILVNNKGELKICDFGLARSFGDPLGSYTPTVVTLWYRAPELLLGLKHYGPSVDVWSLGCILGELLQRKPLFTGKSEVDQINKIANVLGTPSEKVWPGFRNLPGIERVKFPHQPYNHLRKLFPGDNQSETKDHTTSLTTPLTDAGFDLLNRLLAYDPNRRITANDAFGHEWFAEFPPPKEQRLMPTFPSRAAGGGSGGQ